MISEAEGVEEDEADVNADVIDVTTLFICFVAESTLASKSTGVMIGLFSPFLAPDSGPESDLLLYLGNEANPFFLNSSSTSRRCQLSAILPFRWQNYIYQ